MKDCILEKWVPILRNRQNRAANISLRVVAIKDQIARNIEKPDRKSTAQALTINRLSPTLISLYTWADISPWSAFSSRIAGISRLVSILSWSPRSILGRSSFGRRSDSSKNELACFSNENANISICRRAFSILVQLDATPNSPFRHRPIVDLYIGRYRSTKPRNHVSRRRAPAVFIIQPIYWKSFNRTINAPKPRIDDRFTLISPNFLLSAFYSPNG